VPGGGTNNTLPIEGDWFLIWDDNFDYGTVDESFYTRGFPWGDNRDIHGKTDCVVIKDNVTVSNGKLILTANYDADSSKIYFERYDWSDPGNPVAIFNHFDYTASAVTTKLSFPINSRFQTNIKVYPNPHKTWPAYWFRGDQDEEIDVFEVLEDSQTSADDAFPERSLKMTYHFKEYGNGQTREEGIHHETFSDLTSSFNQFDLVWDKWKVDWYFNSQIVHQITKFYHSPFNTTFARDRNYRKFPIKDHATFSSFANDDFFVNKYFPDGGPMKLIFNVALQSDATPSDVGSGKTQEIENLKIWTRGYCSLTVNVWGANFYNRSTIEVGGIVRLFPFTIPADHVALYAATDYIEFKDGFSADFGSDVFAFISTCGGAWDSRTVSNVSLDEERLNEDFFNESDLLEKPSIATYESNLRNDITILNQENSVLILCSTGNILSIDVMNMQGAIIYSKKDNNTNQLEISKEAISSGIYTAKIATATGVDVRKLWLIR
jgi:hypothetical protein